MNKVKGFCGAAMAMLGMVLGLASVQAQYITSTSRLTGVPQHTDLFPGSRPQLKGWLGMTGLSAVALRLDNTLLHPEGLFSPGPAGGTVVHLERLLDQLLSDNNQVGVSQSIELASLGFSGGELGESIWSFRIRERAEFDLQLPGDLLTLPMMGNAPGSFHDFSGLSLRAIHFREYSAGWNRAWGERIHTGVRLNYLYGMECAELTQFEANWHTDPTTYAYGLSASGAFRSSGLNTIQDMSNDLENYLLYRDNRGWSMDFGFQWAITDRIQAGAHILDAGRIEWVEDLQDYTLDASNYSYAGPTIQGEDDLALFEGDSLSNWLEAEVDVLDSLFIPNAGESPFATVLPVRLIGEGSFAVRETDKATTRVHGMYMGRMVEKSIADWMVSVGLVHAWSQRGALNVVWNQFGKGYGAVGAALSLNLGIFQWHLAVDNVLLSPWTALEWGDETVKLPNRADVISIQTGFNLTFGRKKRSPKDAQELKNETSRRKAAPCENFMARSGR